MQKNTGITRIIKACGYSRDGLIAVFKSEAAFRQELLLAAILIPVALFTAPDAWSFGMMVSSLLLVLIVEIINSAIEAVVDRAGTEIHPLAKKAKDAGSAAVLLALINAGLVWICVWI
jgi:diacylglycerol kinase (ATP)